jgi:dTMP kinase
VVRVREPGGTPIGERIRKLLLDGDSVIGGAAEALLYAAARAQLVDQVILPALARGEVVVADRFIDSSLAYQGVARGLGLEQVLQANELATGGLMPDITRLDCRPNQRPSAAATV